MTYDALFPAPYIACWTCGRNLIGKPLANKTDRSGFATFCNDACFARWHSAVERAKREEVQNELQSAK